MRLSPFPLVLLILGGSIVLSSMMATLVAADMASYANGGSGVFGQYSGSSNRSINQAAYAQGMTGFRIGMIGMAIGVGILSVPLLIGRPSPPKKRGRNAKRNES